MPRLRHIRPAIRRLASDSHGAAMVEFAISFPFMLLVFGMIVEGSRLMWDYQSAIAGVRDAARYVARVVPHDVCSTNPSGTSLAGYMPSSTNRAALFPSRVTVGAVTPVLDCRAGSGTAYRNDPAPVVMLSATVTISFPFGSLLSFAGQSFTNVTTVVTDESRIFGS
jgi:Flp pilus assembly protein TadG